MLPLRVLGWRGASWEAPVLAKRAYGAFSLWLNIAGRETHVHNKDVK